MHLDSGNFCCFVYLLCMDWKAFQSCFYKLFLAKKLTSLEGQKMMFLRTWTAWLQSHTSQVLWKLKRILYRCVFGQTLLLTDYHRNNVWHKNNHFSGKKKKKIWSDRDLNSWPSHYKGNVLTIIPWIGNWFFKVL